ncbi:DUF4880 domain-containing protein [Paraburkholderia acidisoli]|uniref:DUF4880 domain-containing protein n=2 Tax=Paraburkholderia acidisoli TaxID=2571748 RepID=A0A7Z2JHF9_9BURK|nr:DUF4880 domain-containing protein [Paraburkholderia acidisoli]
MAGGLPISETVADEAAEWVTLLMSGEATDDDLRRLQAWRAASPDHERAWRHVEAVSGRLKVLETHAAYRSLSSHGELAAKGRRRVVSVLLWGGAIGAGGAWITRTATWQSQLADYHTATGEQRAVALNDGSRILLDTGSAIDVRFDARRRVVRLIAGEMMVVTGHALVDGAPDARPFIVETGEGQIRALGTRFTVRQNDDHTAVAVLESAVEIQPDDAPGLRHVLHAGERTTFTRRAVAGVAPLAPQDSAWTRGQLVADEMRLRDFLDELARYRPGIVRCDPQVADLRFSGVFPLDDTDRILETLPTVLPVQVRQRTRYWVTVTARS